MTINQIAPKTQYALRAQEVAKELGLRSAIYPYLEILDSVNTPNYLDKILKCCEVTGTELNDQLKFLFANSKSVYTPSIGVIRYDDRMNFKKFGQLLIETKKFPNLKINEFSTHNANPKKLGIDPYFIGINEMAYYAVKNYDNIHILSEGIDWVPVPYVFDNLIRGLSKICFPIGSGKADELFVLESDTLLGENGQLDTFLEKVIGREAVLFGDIRK